MQRHLRVNHQIRSSEVNLIDEEGKSLGIFKLPEALTLAREQDLDLVEVGSTAQPPVVKILDYGKYRYQLEKQEKKSGGKQKAVEMKTVRIGFKTGQHDLDFKRDKIHEFLAEGHQVRVELTLRGREKALAEMGRKRFEAFLAQITDPHSIFDPIKRSPRGWAVSLQRTKK